MDIPVIAKKLRDGFCKKMKSKSVYLSISKRRIRKANLLLWSAFRAMLLFTLSFVLLYPLIYMVSIAFRPNSELFDPAVIWIPKRLVMDNLVGAFRVMKYVQAVAITVKVDIMSSILQVISCALIGYGFARFKFKGKEILFSLLIFTIIVPPQTIIIPTYLNFRFFDFFGLGKLLGSLTGKAVNVNLLNTVLTFYLPAVFGTGIRSGLFIYIFRQFFRGLPKELEDAAYIDGCNHFTTFLKVMVPNAGPAFLTVFLFSVVWYWNDYFHASMFIQNVNTVSVALAKIKNSLDAIQGTNADPYMLVSWMQAGSLLAVLPLLLMYIFLQKYFNESIERTGIVG